jgi:hypothetical protein
MIWGKILIAYTSLLSGFLPPIVTTWPRYPTSHTSKEYCPGIKVKIALLILKFFLCNTVGYSLTAIKKALEYDTYKLTNQELC